MSALQLSNRQWRLLTQYLIRSVKLNIGGDPSEIIKKFADLYVHVKIMKRIGQQQSVHCITSESTGKEGHISITISSRQEKAGIRYYIKSGLSFNCTGKEYKTFLSDIMTDWVVVGAKEGKQRRLGGGVLRVRNRDEVMKYDKLWYIFNGKVTLIGFETNTYEVVWSEALEILIGREVYPGLFMT